MKTSSWGRIGAFLRANWIPVLALLGLAGGLSCWAGGQDAAANWVWLGTLLVGGLPLIGRTLRGMVRGQFAADIVAMLAILTAILMDEAFAGLIVVLMQSGGEALEGYALRRASSSLEALLARAPRTAWRQAGAHLEEIAVEAVRVGDRLVVRPGALIPVDGILCDAQAAVDEAALTGEPLTQSKHHGDALLSGSVNLGGAFAMAATRPSDQSQYARIVALVRQAQDDKPPLGRLADRYAVGFTPLTLLMAGLGWAITGDVQTILAVLVVATPCPLILATPIAIISGINRAAQAGIIVKGGAAIEQIGRAQAVVFDKTGTLTYGRPSVERIVPANGLAPATLLRQAASVEQFSSHLLGQTLVRAAQAAGEGLPLPANFREVPGHGVEGDLEGHHVVVGSARFVTERLARAPGSSPLAPAGDALAAFIAVDGHPAGTVIFRDQLRPGVPALIARLRALGVHHTVLLTGDRAGNAQAVAAQSGIDQVAAELLPQDKVAVLHRLKTQYDPLVMVGDGINDAPALATATVGVAMGAQGTGISAEAADIVLLVDDVTRVGEAVAIGQRTLHIARQSIGAGLGLSFVLMVVAAGGLIPPAVGALCQEVVDVVVILNALRAR